MSNSYLLGNERSGEQADDHADGADGDAGDVAVRAPVESCPECDSQVVTEDRETYCVACGLVVAERVVDRQPTLRVHGPSERGGGHQEWAIESVNNLRVDRGMHTTFFLNSDGYGNPFSITEKDKWERLRRRQKRFQWDDRRLNRLQEAFRDVEHVGGNLGLPRYVQEDAGRMLRKAHERRLPGGRMSWEALAGAAVLLAARAAGLDREIEAVAEYAKTSTERLCAAARKLRIECDLAVGPIRERAVEQVLVALDVELSAATTLELAHIGQALIEVADAEGIGPGTPRMTVAGAAVYAADRLTDGKALTQAAVVEATSATVDSSKSKLGRYSRELYDAAVDRGRDAVVGDERVGVPVA